jgi:5'-phosphate synthase pdxT subunit
MTVAVLAVQGAFIEHEKMLEQLGVSCIELRKKEDLDKEFDALVLPGGESTVQGKLLNDLGMFQPLQQCIQAGMPVLATCAGLILLAQNLSNDEHVWFGTMPVTVERNAYGRQLGSFYAEEEITRIGTFPMEFIRAPYIKEVGEGVEILASVEDRIVMAQYKNQLAMAFHPELTDNLKVHAYFVDMIEQVKCKSAIA